MRPTASLPLLPYLSAALLTAAACTTPDDGAGLGSDEAAVMGGTSYSATCPADVQAYVEDTMLHGRIALGSAAFAQCLEQGLRTSVTIGTVGVGPYTSCDGDPDDGLSMDVQVPRVLAAARTPASLQFTCDPNGAGNANAQIASYDHAGAEVMTLSGWFFNAARTFYKLPPCPLGDSSGDGTSCVVNPWGAGIIAHEVLHQRGYGHGDNNDNAAARTACGIPATTPWHFQFNTAPYIVGYCVDAVLRQSELTCGPLDTCPAGSVKILDGLTATTCHCEVDPGVDPMAGGPAAIMNGAGNLDVVVRSATNVARERVYANNAWQPWGSRGGTLASQPSAVVYGTKTYLFARRGDSGAGANGLMAQIYDPATGWGAWNLIDSAPLGSAPAPVISEGRIVVFARTPAGTLTHKIFQNNAWSPWYEIAGGNIASAPSAVVVNGKLMVFARATSDHALVSRYWDGAAGAWTAWRSHGGVIQSAPSAVMAGARLAVYATNPEGTLFQIFSDDAGATYSSWVAFSGAISSAPTAMMAGARLVIFARGTDGALLHRYYDNGWTGWISLGS